MSTTRAASSGIFADVTGGSVRGFTSGDLRHWRGIPYAAAPVGTLRFRAPQPVTPWDGVRDVSRFGAISYQSRIAPAAQQWLEPQSEDCLSINVISPRAPAAAALPVMVFIHGGAYTAGSSREIPRLGEALVRQGDVLFVNFNYRLGALGYLDFSRFSNDKRVFDTNLGLRDQLAALRWVRDNIREFGGDPDNVTVFGESAGANAITTMLAVPAAAGLFTRAIVESAAPAAVYQSELTTQWGADYVEILRELARNTTATATDLLTTTDAPTLTRAASLLRQRTPDAVPGTIAFAPVIDGDLLPQHPLDAAAEGRTHAVPLIIGTNAREGSLFRGRLDLLASTRPRIRAVFARTEREARRRLFDEYRALPLRTSAAQFGGDYSFWYPSIRFAEGHAQHAPVHFYRFDLATPALRLIGLDATHGLELFAVFDLGDTVLARAGGLLGGRSEFKRAGARMRARWLSFARDGAVGENWPTYSTAARETLIIDVEERVESDPHESRRVAWQAFVPHL